VTAYTLADCFDGIAAVEPRSTDEAVLDCGYDTLRGNRTPFVFKWSVVRVP
jgi:hypothetical protein